MYIELPVFLGVVIIIVIALIILTDRINRLRADFDVNVGKLWDKVELLEKQKQKK